MKNGQCGLCKLCWVLVIIGALNWGLVGFFDWNLVEWLLGTWPVVERVVYALVGVAALVMIFSHRGMCKMCKTK
ncbi:hypothetical protein A3B32_01330 [Candidatus Uhrbacteria bacterium RIFCSPLOWO2_01_FULL_53_9]|uniref:DUF378 domain-containing protein n=3 Tax=Candidatus Uhriibacteriota TaxID=1752732 RepID=A0A1F7UZ21_9BACT|nr:MAG: hypothetical protein A3C17_02115 [Candidatus Uhrbacteria bacterium RIFCSPHIGHO2_02_FULL_53_13]OGL83532.1 MAG: hypothetical protein A3B32_01330 [Candidatus Uhrbacteria bacterium RIFCSPLOWO2_01_FULL_53_9]OGL90011.1 MAG: hypothetical protein A3I45_01665 [Candidatus Uhrbacteria bacterium RIFCSPLOWO2_02_FULL_53_10]